MQYSRIPILSIWCDDKQAETTNTHAYYNSDYVTLQSQSGSGLGIGTVPDASLHLQVMEHCRGGDLFKTLMMKGGSLDEHWVCTEVRS